MYCAFCIFVSSFDPGDEFVKRVVLFVCDKHIPEVISLPSGYFTCFYLQNFFLTHLSRMDMTTLIRTSPFSILMGLGGILHLFPSFIKHSVSKQ